MTDRRKVIVAPLNWGLGHASRCVPIIRSLLDAKYLPVFAGDGKSLELLKKEFPTLEVVALPSYQISYGKSLKWNLIKRIPKIRKAVKKEHQLLQEYIAKNTNVVGIISDNRFGVYSNKIPSVYITHQINVLWGFLTPITRFFHQRIIKKFDECWIPDEPNSEYSGKLSFSKQQLNQKYVGVVSRFERKDLKKTLDILVILSGPEPNRTLLEKKIIKKFYGSKLNVCMVKGVVEETQKLSTYGKLKIVNYMLSDELETTINSAKKVICRSGYTSVLDLVTLQKEALFIPTKGQTEQEYLAKYLKNEKLFDFVKEKDFSKKEINLIEGNSKIECQKQGFDKKLFRLFEGK